MFGLFSPVSISIKTPKAIEPTATDLNLSVILTGRKKTIIEQLDVRLNATPVKRNSHNSSEYIGEVKAPGAITLEPDKSQEMDFSLPIDFSKLNKFDIPPENMAMASEELKAAAATSQPSNYRYNLEVSYKPEGKKWRTAQESIRLNTPEDVRVG